MKNLTDFRKTVETCVVPRYVDLKHAVSVLFEFIDQLKGIDRKLNRYGINFILNSIT